MGADLFNIGVSGLRAQQTALAVTGQNITNASTPGYSRQRVEMSPQTAGTKGGQFEGAGARVDRITRVADGFVSNQIRLDSALFSELDAMNRQIGQIEGVLLNDAASLNTALDSFFNAMQTASSTPSSMPFRQMVLSEAQGLAERFGAMHERLSSQGYNVVAELESGVARINELAQGIGALNDRIASLKGVESSGAANSLLDQRDEMLKELATYVSVSTNAQNDGRISVFIGKGQALILGTSASQLAVTSQGEITLQADNRSAPTTITSALQGGEMGGLLRFRAEVLDPAINRLGLIAHSVARSVNSVHASGVDLNGDLGGLLFADLNDSAVADLRVIGRESNTGRGAQIRVTLDDPFNVPVTDYELAFDDASEGGFFVRRLSDGRVVHQGTLNGALPQRVGFDGITLELMAGDYAPGDRFRVRPLADAAGSFKVAMTDPALLALAGPLSVATAVGNRGSGEATIGEIFDRDHPIFGAQGALTPPLLIRFTSPTTYEILDNSDPASPRSLNPPLVDLPYDPRQVNQLLPEQLGQSRVRFEGTDIAALGAAVIGPITDSLANGYRTQTIQARSIDPVTGTVTGIQSVNVPANSSARQIATALSSMSGVSASASNSVTLQGLSSNGIGFDLEVSVNGINLGAVSSLNELADRIAANPALSGAGVTALSDGQILTLSSSFGDDLVIQVAGDPTDNLTVVNQRGEMQTLNGVGAAGQFRGVSIGGAVTAVTASGIRLASDTSTLMRGDPVHLRADFGFGLSMTGAPAAGDSFAIGLNRNGVGDNRNALALAGLSASRLIGRPPVSFSDSYGELVQFVGVKSSQSHINREAAGALLEQSLAQRESISGVNLDEEAANLIRFEQAYNASAQIISVARDIFNTLFSIMR